MRRLPTIRLSTRLFLAVLATAVLVVAMVGGASQWNFERGFLGYLNELAQERTAFIVPRLERAYAEHGSWDFLRDEPRRWFGLLRPRPGEDLPSEAQMQPGMMPNSDLTGAMVRMGLLDLQLQWVAGYRRITPEMPRQALLAADGRTVAGWLVLAPVRRVAAATHRLAAGDHAVRVAVDSQDEVGQLAQDFNHLAHTLGRNEALRREFIADVSHELRTPLAVLRGELEALEDGIRPLNAAAVQSLQAEVGQLGQLVDDLYELALSDAGALSYRMAPLDLGALLQRVAAAHEARLQAAGLALRLQLPASPLPLQADEGRLQQLLDNLLENSRRYTDAPGHVQLAVQPLAGSTPQWLLTLDDSAPGVPAEVLGQLFERFFRVDGSRSRATGGAGLGLAICRNIVLAHGGQISAGPSALGGVRIEVRLPQTPSAPTT